MEERPLPSLWKCLGLSPSDFANSESKLIKACYDAMVADAKEFNYRPEDISKLKTFSIKLDNMDLATPRWRVNVRQSRGPEFEESAISRDGEGYVVQAAHLKDDLGLDTDRDVDFHRSYREFLDRLAEFATMRLDNVGGVSAAYFKGSPTDNPSEAHLRTFRVLLSKSMPFQPDVREYLSEHLSELLRDLASAHYRHNSQEIFRATITLWRRMWKFVRELLATQTVPEFLAAYEQLLGYTYIRLFPGSALPSKLSTMLKDVVTQVNASRSKKLDEKVKKEDLDAVDILHALWKVHKECITWQNDEEHAHQMLTTAYTARHGIKVHLDLDTGIARDGPAFALVARLYTLGRLQDIFDSFAKTCWQVKGMTAIRIECLHTLFPDNGEPPAEEDIADIPNVLLSAPLVKPEGALHHSGTELGQVLLDRVTEKPRKKSKAQKKKKKKGEQKGEDQKQEPDSPGSSCEQRGVCSELQMLLHVGGPNFYPYIGGSHCPCWQCGLLLESLGVYSKASSDIYKFGWSIPRCLMGVMPSDEWLDQLGEAIVLVYQTQEDLFPHGSSEIPKIKTYFPLTDSPYALQMRDTPITQQSSWNSLQRRPLAWVQGLLQCRQEQLELHQYLSECDTELPQYREHWMSFKTILETCDACIPDRFCRDHQGFLPENHPHTDFPLNERCSVDGAVKRCSQCKFHAGFRCWTCLSAWYGGPFCHFKDRSAHRSICFEYAKLQMDPAKPGHDHLLVLVFPTDSVTPRLEWVKKEKLPDVPDQESEQPEEASQSEGIKIDWEKEKALGHLSEVPETLRPQAKEDGAPAPQAEWPMLEYILGDEIHFFTSINPRLWPDHLPGDMARHINFARPRVEKGTREVPNLSFTSTLGSAAHRFSGTVVMVIQTGPYTWDNFRPEDLSTLVQFSGQLSLTDPYSWDPKKTNDWDENLVEFVQSFNQYKTMIRINSDLCARTYHWPQYQEILVKNLMLARPDSGASSPISKRLGIELITFQSDDKLPLNLKSRPPQNSLMEDVIGPLHQVIDRNSAYFGTVHPTKIAKPGSTFRGSYFAVWAGETHRPLSLITSLVRFCKDIQNLFRRSYDETNKKKGKPKVADGAPPVWSYEQILGLICPEQFKRAVIKYETCEDTWTEKGLTPWEV